MPEAVKVVDPVLRSARREMFVTFAIFLTAVTYTGIYCGMHGYGRDAKSLTFVLGFPDWIFWGIVTPWVTCVVISQLFGAFVMRDGDLGEELPSEEDGQ